jgi:hypothetical protein
VCYAYLADVPHGAVTDEKIRESRWFSRSWTLQELIAPLTVIFSDSEWYPIGGKLDRQKLIPEITGIPGNFLLRDEVRYASVAQRMSWASWRKTTRSENIAYSLMGLLGICMPMSDGKEKGRSSDFKRRLCESPMITASLPGSQQSMAVGFLQVHQLRLLTLAISSQQVLSM